MNGRPGYMAAPGQLRQKAVQLLRDMPRSGELSISLREADTRAIIRDCTSEPGDVCENGRPRGKAGPRTAFEHHDRAVGRVIGTSRLDSHGAPVQDHGPCVLRRGGTDQGYDQQHGRAEANPFLPHWFPCPADGGQTNWRSPEAPLTTASKRRRLQRDVGRSCR